jgi:hypothetical protein
LKEKETEYSDNLLEELKGEKVRLQFVLSVRLIGVEPHNELLNFKQLEEAIHP